MRASCNLMPNLTRLLGVIITFRPLSIDLLTATADANNVKHLCCPFSVFRNESSPPF